MIVIDIGLVLMVVGVIGIIATLLIWRFYG